jgi:uncharacterized protein (DUF433 family)
VRIILKNRFPPTRDQRGVGLGHAGVEAGVPGVLEDALAGDLGGHLEAGVEAGLERALAEQARGEGVDGGDGGALQVEGCGLEALALLVFLRCVDRGLDLFSQPELQLARGLLGEGDGDDAVERGAAGADEGEDAADEDGGLAGAGAGFEQQRGVEVAQDAGAGGLVGGEGHEYSDLPWPGRAIGFGRARYTMSRTGEEMTPRELLAELAALSKAEKAEVVERLAQQIGETWPGIEKSPGVAGGSACIVRTRIPVWSLENYRRLGWTEAKILANYPTLRAADLVHAWAYVDAHGQEIDQAIRENEAA